MARINELLVGQHVTVVRGYSARRAVVREVRYNEGKVSVSFTDVSCGDLARVPAGQRAGLLAATVRPNAIRL